MANLTWQQATIATAVSDRHTLSFACQPITSQKAWKNLENTLWEYISAEYGNYYHNIHGVIEHRHYHLGQIV